MDEQTPGLPGSEPWRSAGQHGPARYVGPAPGRRDDRQLRVSDGDRDAAVAELGEHFGAGRLDAAEFEDRTARALRARVGRDLDELLADLPAAPQPPAAPPTDARTRRTLPPLLVPALVAAALITAILLAGGRGGWHHQWAAGWALWWVVPVIVLRALWWRRVRGARPWR